MQSLREIKARILELRNSGALYNRDTPYEESTFRASLDRFALILHRLQGRRDCLDIDPGLGLLPLLDEFGHTCKAVDMVDYATRFPHIYKDRSIEFRFCNIEVDAIPYEDNSFDAVTCCQALEHFTHSHLPAVKEMHRILKPGGILEIDVPNAVCFRNRWRMLRGKHITWDYKKHYLFEEPVLYKNMSFFPDRHNRDFVKADLVDLFTAAGFKNIEVRYIHSRRHREGLERLKNIGTGIKDAIPSLRKTVMGFGEK